MVYKACFSCELLFEVDEGVEARCPECGGLLEDYQAEEGGLPFDEEGDEDGFNEPTAAFSPEQLQRLTEGDSISETSTYEGFSARVRANVAQHNESAFSSRAPEPTTALKLSEVEGGAFSSRAPEPTTALKLSEVEGGAFSSRAPEPTTALKLSEVEGGAFSSRAPEPTTALKLSEVEGHPAPASPFAAPAANPFGGGSAGDFSAPTSPSNAAPPIQRAAPSVSPSALDKAPDSPFGARAADGATVPLPPPTEERPLAAPPERATRGYESIPRPNTPPQPAPSLESSGDHRTTRILDLNSDIPDDLPPTQALPQFTEEGLPVSQGIRGAPAPAATPAPTPHRSLTPPQGAGPSPDNLAARLSGGAAAPPRRAVSAVKDPDRPTIMAMGPPPSSKPWGIIIGGVVAGLALVGGIAFWALSGDPPPPEAPPAPPAPVELSWEERLNEQLSSASAMLPAAEGTEALEESHYIAAGPEGLHSHLGNIPGLPSSQQPKGSLASDERGAWSRPVFQALSKQPTPPSANALFALALDSQVPFHVSLRLAYAAKRAGYAIQGIVAQRTEAAGKLGLLSFKIKDLKDPFPARGALALRIGTLGFNVAVRDGQNKVISAGNPRIPRKEKNNNLDFFALEKRLNALSAAHGEVSEVVFYPAPKMSIEDGVRILSMLAMSRFNQIWIQLPR